MAAGQVEALRGSCVNLVRIAQGIGTSDEPYFKIDVEASTVELDPLLPSYVPVGAEALARAGSGLVAFFGEHGRRLADAHGIAYPSELDHLLRDASRGSRSGKVDVTGVAPGRWLG